MSSALSVVVVGGGPAGSSAAVTLARAGVEVVLVDRARFPREKCCGDGLTTGCLRRLDAIGLDPRSVASFTEVDALIASSPSGRVVRVPLKGAAGVYGAVARRSDLDAALIELARSAGVKVVDGDGVAAIATAPRGSGITITLKSGAELRAPVLLAADGARSTVRRLVRAREDASAVRAGELPGRDSWLAYRQYVSSVSDQAARELWVRFDSALLPGYGWSFPLGDGRANVGIGVPRQTGTSGHELRRAWTDTLASAFFTSLLGHGATLEGAVRAWPIPTGVRRQDLTAWGGRILFLGDAAATADPFTGEGIAQALESGVLAAHAVLAGGTDGAATYESMIARALFTEQRISRGARALLSVPLGARAAIRGTGLGPRITNLVGRWLYEEYPRTVLTRPGSWRALRAVRPGAFANLEKAPAATR
jgi:geranylgeranyl reductase family protein